MSVPPAPHDAGELDPDADAHDEEPPPEACDAGGGGTTWLDDPCLWDAVSALDVCQVSQARLPSATYPARIWESCGDGCRAAFGNLIDQTKLFGLVPGWFDADATYVRLLFSAGPHIREVLDVTHDIAMAAFQTRHTEQGGYADCIDYRDPLGPNHIEVWNKSLGSYQHTTYYALSRYRETPALEVFAGNYDWGDAELFDVGTAAVSTETHWGYLDAHAMNTLHISDGFGAVPPFVPVTTPSDGEHLRAWNATFLWHDRGYAPGRVHAWSPSLGQVEVAPPVKPVFASTIANAGAVWLAAHEVAAGAGPWQYAGLDLWRAPDPAAPAPALVASDLLATGLNDYPIGMAAGDDFAAATICHGTDGTSDVEPAHCPLVVVQLSTGQVWRLGPPTATSFWSDPSVINVRELVVAERPDTLNSYPTGWGAERLFVLDMTKLDAVAAQFPYPPAP